MSKYLTEGPVFICPRCHMKRYIKDQVVDPNNQLRVCSKECADVYDPWRLPARKPEDITLRYPRPDEPVST